MNFVNFFKISIYSNSNTYFKLLIKKKKCIKIYICDINNYLCENIVIVFLYYVTINCLCIYSLYLHSNDMTIIKYIIYTIFFI